MVDGVKSFIFSFLSVCVVGKGCWRVTKLINLNFQGMKDNIVTILQEKYETVNFQNLQSVYWRK